MPPSAIVHIVSAIVITEHKLVDGLCAIHNFINQGLAQHIFERTCRIVCHSHTDTANLRVVLYVVPSEEKIIAVIGLDNSRRPQSTAQPWDIFL